MTPQEQASHAIKVGLEYRYDGRKDVVTDPAIVAALGICYDLCDRAGIKHEMGRVDREVRADIVDAFAEIIRTAWEEPPHDR